MNTITPTWANKAHRLIPSHFPPISLFEDVANEDEFEILYAVESLTNDRLLEELGQLTLVAPEDRIYGQGSTPVMAAFTHIGMPSRFTNGQYGVYYCGSTLDVAIAETRYHRELFLATTREPDTEITMREYINEVVLPVADIRGSDFDNLHQPNSYDASQAFAKQQLLEGANGLLYRSVRLAGGECCAIFKPKALSSATQGCHLRYVWNGNAQRITDVLEVRMHT
ncbi:MAG: RES family NAD+ phosphorylase [Alteromonas stellipolaris]|uniref:RES family NAD+ phosphorylase n=1 Tax=Alteromonas stellipolaris TaxID=233316 RepID=UPI003B8C642B